MDQKLIELKKAYDAKQTTQDEMGQLLKLGEEAAELAAAVNKYVEIKAGLYSCKSGPDTAFKHVIEEACDVYTMLNVCGLTHDSARNHEVRGQIIHRLVYKAYRFIGQLDMFKEWEKSQDPNTKNKEELPAGHKHRKGKGKGKHGNVRKNVFPGIDIILRIPRDMSGCAGVNSENPWREGMEGDFE